MNVVYSLTIKAYVFHYQSASFNKRMTIDKKLWVMKLLQVDLARNGTISTTSIQLKKGWIQANILQRCFTSHIYYAIWATPAH